MSIWHTTSNYVEFLAYYLWPHRKQKTVILRDSNSAVESIVQYKYITLKKCNDCTLVDTCPCGIYGKWQCCAINREREQVLKNLESSKNYRNKRTSNVRMLYHTSSVWLRKISYSKTHKNVEDRTDLLNIQRKTATTFKLETEHFTLAKHLRKIECLQTPKCVIVRCYSK